MGRSARRYSSGLRKNNLNPHAPSPWQMWILLFALFPWLFATKAFGLAHKTEGGFNQSIGVLSNVVDRSEDHQRSHSLEFCEVDQDEPDEKPVFQSIRATTNFILMFSPTRVLPRVLNSYVHVAGARAPPASLT